ncbi:MAG: OprD family outer membrane porin, partial [Acidithiobacillus sp.]|uniref:OprD family outer membrane porin n=1 Tax=Acidithiobacillus sp. TaxID=1872118 RepID=UPI003D093DE3
RNMTNRNAFLLAFGLSMLAPCSQADTLAQIIHDGSVSGDLRSYYFSKLYGTPKKENQDAYSLGGIINARSGSLDGFSVGLSFFTANSLGTHGANGTGVDTTLMGIAPSINALGQAYLQYQIPRRFLLRIGNQIINTPWMGARDSRMLPQTFQGIFAEAEPITGLTIKGMRIFRWKSRTSSNYYRDNLYYPTNYDEDPLYGVKKVGLKDNTPASNGTLAFGAQYQTEGTKLAAWYYDFYQFSNLFYGSAQYGRKIAGVTPYLAGQFMREWENDGILQHYQASLFGQKGSVNATLWGIKVGVKVPLANLFFAYNELRPHAHSFGGGAIVSPYGNYTAMYASFMTDNLLAFGPGHAWRLGADLQAWQKQIRFLAGYAHFNTNYEGRTNGVYLDLTYFPRQVRGLSIRDRVAIDNGLAAYAGHSFIYNRLMLQYAF